MATQTTNLGLTKPGYDEAADVVPAVNNNMDILDEKMGAVPANTSVQAQITANAQAIAKLDESIAIVSNGNTHAAIAAGQYVYIKGHGTLAEGLYTANSAISANATLSNSNVTAVSGGGLNALNSKITQIGTEYKQASADDTKSAGSKQITVPAGTYLISFGGQVATSDVALMQLGINDYSPWIEDYISSYVPNNTSGMNSVYKTVLRTFNDQHTITSYYTAGWYYTELKAILLK